MATPLVYLVRHGQTAWSLSGQHTGRTDIPLTPAGEAASLAIAERLRGIAFAKVFTSPLQRAKRTCEISGYGGVAEVDHDLVEWDYGQYEGKKTVEIKALAPAWDLFQEGCPGGETAADVSVRADNAIARVRAVAGTVLLFSSGHFLRVFAARWCGLDASFARHLLLGTGSVSVLGYDHDNLAEPALKSWNLTA